jgi:aminoglycoside 6-adenylyltransferase
MRSSGEILNLILKIAESDYNIRAVLLNGSRANPKARTDKYQDFDIVYIVSHIETFLYDHSWIDIFGERIILQMPDEMTIGIKDEKSVGGAKSVAGVFTDHNHPVVGVFTDHNRGFHYLMLFKDKIRIDLTLFPVEKLETFKKSSLTILLLDKDNLFKNLPPPSDEDYLIQPPSEKEFNDCCNEFWWVSTYVAKGLARNEIIYALEMLEIHVRPMFLKIIEWYIGIEKSFSVSFGMHGKFMKDHISPELYEKILSTYPGGNTENIWSCLFLMTKLFSDLADKISTTLELSYNIVEELNVMEYLKEVYEESKQM